MTQNYYKNYIFSNLFIANTLLKHGKSAIFALNVCLSLL